MPKFKDLNGGEKFITPKTEEYTCLFVKLAFPLFLDNKKPELKTTYNAVFVGSGVPAEIEDETDVVRVST